MRGTGSSTTTTPVALRKESVDRNHAVALAEQREVRRSPQGERG